MGGKRSLAVAHSVCDSTISACHVFGSGDDQFRTPFDLWECALNCWTCGGSHSTSDCNLAVNPWNPTTALLCAGLQRSLSSPYPKMCKVFIALAGIESSVQGQSIELCSSCVEDIFGSFSCAEDYLKKFQSASLARVVTRQEVEVLPMHLFGMCGFFCGKCGSWFDSLIECLPHELECYLEKIPLLHQIASPYLCEQGITRSATCHGWFHTRLCIQDSCVHLSSESRSQQQVFPKRPCNVDVVRHLGVLDQSWSTDKERLASAALVAQAPLSHHDFSKARIRTVLSSQVATLYSSDAPSEKMGGKVAGIKCLIRLTMCEVWRAVCL